MPSAPFPDPDPDAPEPSGSGSGSGSGPQPVPAGGNDADPQSPQSAEPTEPAWSGDEEEAADYLGELMAAVAGGEELTAEDICGAGFGQDGTAEQMHPGPVLAALVHAATTDDKILATLPDDDLIGVIAAVRRVGSFAAWAEMTAVREFATRPDPRRPASGAAPGAVPGATPDGTPGAAPGGTCGAGRGAASGGRGGVRGIDGRDPNAAVAGLPGRPVIREFAADELAPDLHLTWQSAVGQIAYACTVAARLPRTFAALRAGHIHPVHVRIIEDETAFLSDQDAAAADAELAEAARSKTFGELRYYAHRLVLKLDPESALRRKEQATRTRTGPTIRPSWTKPGSTSRT